MSRQLDLLVDVFALGTRAVRRDLATIQSTLVKRYLQRWQIARTRNRTDDGAGDAIKPDACPPAASRESLIVSAPGQTTPPRHVSRPDRKLLI